MSVVLATAGYDHIIRFWEAPTGVCIRMIKFVDSQINRLEITPDKQFIAAAGNPHIRLYEIQQSTGTISSNNNNSSIMNDKNTQDPTVLTLEGHTGNVTSLGFQKDGRYLYTGSEDGTLKVWDLSNPYCSRSYNVGAPVNSVCLRTDRDEFITGDQNGYVKIWDLGGSGGGSNKNGLIHSVKPSAPSSAFKSLISPTTQPSSSNTLVDTSIDEHDDTNQSKRNTTSHIAGRRIRRNHQPFTQHHHRYTEGIVPIQSVDISEDSRTLVAVTNRGTVYVWDPSSNNNLPLLNNTNEVRDDLSNTTTPTTALNTSDGYLRPITKFRAHTEHPGTYCLHGKIAPDCRHLVTTASDGTAKLWDTTTWELAQALIQQPIATPPGNHRSPPSKTSNKNNTNITTPNKSVPPLSKWVWDAAFCADSSYLVTASSDRVARLWNLRTGDVVRHYCGHLSAVTCVALNDSSIE
jgi:target of rapamycin complex subunit LST8